MNILIITTWYPPDTAIAAVRPYMLAKYLSASGHNITVIRSGLINKITDDFYPELENVEVISYMENESAAETFKIETTQKKQNKKSRLDRLPVRIRGVVSRTYRMIRRPAGYIHQRNIAKDRYSHLKEAIDKIGDRSYDIVFSTFSDIENAYGGRYASKVFGCKWVMDFRDPIAQRGFQPFWEYIICKREQDKMIEDADLVTAVSDGQFLVHGKRNNKIITINNGYEMTKNNNDISRSSSFDIPKNVLTFCYTGQIYRERTDAAEAFVNAIASLINEGTVDPDKIRLYYAGNGSDNIAKLVRKYGVEQELVDLGYLPRGEIEALQDQTDIFLVLSWNTRFEKGVLTGKFYEGLRANKPILAIVAGDVPGSELYNLNEQYKYGWCCDMADNNSFTNLCKCISEAYIEKMNFGKVKNETSEEIKTRFRYDIIAKRLEKQFIELLQEAN